MNEEEATESSNAEAERLHSILNELIRVTEGMLKARVSFDTIYEYMDERTGELDFLTMQRVLIFSVLEVLTEREKLERLSRGEA